MPIPTLAESIELAERVHVTERHDRFAAAVLAEAHLHWLERGAPLLHTADERGRWRLAQNTLREAVRRARTNPRIAAELDLYPLQLARYEAALAALDGTPEKYVRVRKAALRAIDVRTPRIVALASVVLAAVASAVALGTGVRALVGVGFVALLVGAACARTWRTRFAARTAARLELHAAWQATAAYAELLADPACGQWLQMIWERHPLLLNEPPPPPAQPVSAVFPVQRIAARSPTAVGSGARLG